MKQAAPVRIHRPISLAYLPPNTGAGIARLSGLEGLTRSLMVGTVPLIALDRLGSKEAVSQAFTVGAVLTLAITLNIGRFEQWFARRWVMTGAIVVLFCAALLFTIDNTVAFVVAIGFRSAGASAFSVFITLYVMDFIGKADLTRQESSRLVYNGVGWLIGPSLGLWLVRNVDEAAPFVLSAFLAVALLAYYWKLRLGDSVVITTAKSSAASPLKNVPRFFKQRYMRVAYTITFVRALTWVALFVYGPIYVVEAGFDEWVAGAFLSGIAALLLASPLIRKLADAIGTRRTVITSFVLIGATMLLVATLGDPRGLGIAVLGLSAVGASAIDVVGNIPFMRMVKPRERVPMATVFSTWREMSALISPLIATVVLGLGLPFVGFYVVIAALSFIAAATATRLPRRL